jgi:hypothetical protein
MTKKEYDEIVEAWRNVSINLSPYANVAYIPEHQAFERAQLIAAYQGLEDSDWRPAPHSIGGSWLDIF